MDFQKYVYNIKSHISKVYSHEIMKNFMLPLLRVIYGKMGFTRSTVEIRLYIQNQPNQGVVVEYEMNQPTQILHTNSRFIPYINFGN